jgi:hypothetical protein|tara:strand:- start:266 stop:670 length:405 start_codon:yes stop_codon:yes gene_type:complete
MNISALLGLLLFVVAPIWWETHSIIKQKRNFIIAFILASSFIFATYIVFFSWIGSIFLLFKFIEKYNFPWFFAIPIYFILGGMSAELMSRIQITFLNLMDNYKNKGIIKTSFDYSAPFIFKLFFNLIKMVKNKK